MGWEGIMVRSHVVVCLSLYQGWVVQSWVKITQHSAKFEFRYESFKSKFSFQFQLFVYNSMIGTLVPEVSLDSFVRERESKLQSGNN